MIPLTEEEQLSKIKKVLRKEKLLSITKIAEEAKLSRAVAAKYLGILKARGEAELDDSEKPYKKYRAK